MKSIARITYASFLFVGLQLSACASQDPSQNVLDLNVGAPCAHASDCDPGLECRAEHGDTTCQRHGETSSSDAAVRTDASSTEDRATATTSSCATQADCASGLECEVEHGVGTCVAHSRDDASASTTDASDSSTDADDSDADDSDASDSGTDADDSDASDSGTDAGHADVAAGAGVVGASCVSDADCAADLECETEHDVSTCQPHRHGGRL